MSARDSAFIPPLTGQDVVRDDLCEPWWVSAVAVLTFAMVVVLLVAAWWACDPAQPSPRDRAPVAGAGR